MTRRFVNLQVWAAQRVQGGRERGQGTLEYVGMVVAVAVVIGAVVVAINQWDLAGKMGNIISQVFPG